MIRIVTDGGADVPHDWYEKYQINAIPLYVRFGDTSYLDGVDISRQQFYDLIDSTKVVPKTSLPGPTQVINYYRSVAQPGDTIISLHLSSKVSGTYSVVKTAADEIKNEFDIHVVDSLCGSAALGFMCRDASVMAEQGQSVEAILKHLLAVRDKLTIHLTLDSLEYAHLNGRISALKALVGSLLKVKPIIGLDNGALDIVSKVRTRFKSVERMIEIASAKVKGKAVRVALVHANDIAMVESMKEKVMQAFDCRELIITDLTVPIAANLGPGTIGLVTYPAV